MNNTNANQDEKPPVFKSWSRWYWLVLSVLAIQILVYLWLTQSFS